MYSITLGVDIAKKKFDVALLIDTKYKYKHFSNDKAGFEAFIQWLLTFNLLTQPLIGMEATGSYSLPLADFLVAQGYPVSAVTRMRHRLKTAEGKAIYAKRKSTVEPVFGVIKHQAGNGISAVSVAGTGGGDGGLDAGLYGLQFEATPCLGRIDLPEGKSNGRQWKKRPINGAFEGTIIIVMRNSRIQP